MLIVLNQSVDEVLGTLACWSNDKSLLLKHIETMSLASVYYCGSEPSEFQSKWCGGIRPYSENESTHRLVVQCVNNPLPPPFFIRFNGELRITDSWQKCMINRYCCLIVLIVLISTIVRLYYKVSWTCSTIDNHAWPVLSSKLNRYQPVSSLLLIITHRS